MKLDKRTLDKSMGMPSFGEQLADVIRKAIMSDQAKPYEDLPSIENIGAMIGASRTVVRTALDILENEGLIIRRAGVPTRVAPRRKPRIVDDSRYLETIEAVRAGEDLTTSAFAEAHGVGLDRVVYDPIRYTEQEAGDDGLWLQIPADAAVLRRYWVKCVIDEEGVPRPKEAQYSVMELDRVEGTDIAKPELQPVPGGILAEIVALGYTEFRETLHEVTGRVPTAEERSALQMETVDRVMEAVRVFVAADGTPLEVSRTITPMSQTVLRFRTDLSR
jgi:GntR family transcriptional regulator